MAPTVLKLRKADLLPHPLAPLTQEGDQHGELVARDQRGRKHNHEGDQGPGQYVTREPYHAQGPQEQRKEGDPVPEGQRDREGEGLQQGLVPAKPESVAGRP